MGGVVRKILPKPPAVVAPTTAEVSQATSIAPQDMSNNMSGVKPEDMSNAEISIANKKKGRSKTILNTSGGLGSSSLNTTKKTLGA